MKKKNVKRKKDKECALLLVAANITENTTRATYAIM